MRLNLSSPCSYRGKVQYRVPPCPENPLISIRKSLGLAAALWHREHPMRKPLDIGSRMGFGRAIFSFLAAAILTRPPKGLGEFDQAYYLTLAYDLEHHGVFSNGVLDDVNST